MIIYNCTALHNSNLNNTTVVQVYMQQTPLSRMMGNSTAKLASSTILELHNISNKIERLKNDLTSLSKQVKDEKANKLTLEQSVALSANIYTTVITFNTWLHSLQSSDEVKATKEVKHTLRQSMNTMSYLIPQIGSLKLDQSFNISEELDWLKKLYYCNRIELRLTELQHPSLRQMIRKKNCQLIKKALNVQDLKEAEKKLLDLKNHKLVLLALEAGLYCSEENITHLLKWLKETDLLAKSFGLISVAAQPEKIEEEEEFPSNEPILLSNPASPAKLSNMSKLEMLVTQPKNKKQEPTYDDAKIALKIILHCLLLYHDLQWQMKNPLHFFENSSLLEQIKSTFFETFTRQNFSVVFFNKKKKVLDLMYRIVFTLFSYTRDPMRYSLSSKVYKSCQSTDRLSQAEEFCELMKTELRHILEGHWKSEKYGTDENLIGKIQTLIDKSVRGPLLEYSASTEEGYQFRIKLLEGNFVHLMLCIAGLGSAHFFHESWRRQIHVILDTLVLYFDGFELAKATLFGHKEWFNFSRIMLFCPCSALRILVVILRGYLDSMANSSHVSEQIAYLLCRVYSYFREPDLYDAGRYNDAAPEGSLNRTSFLRERDIKDNFKALMLITGMMRHLLDQTCNIVVRKKLSVLFQMALIKDLEGYALNKLRGNISWSDTLMNSDLSWIGMTLDEMVTKTCRTETVKQDDGQLLEWSFIHSLMYTFNTTCLYTLSFSDTIFKEYGIDPDETELSSFYSLVNSELGCILFTEVIKLYSHICIAENYFDAQEFVDLNSKKELDSQANQSHHLKVLSDLVSQLRYQKKVIAFRSDTVTSSILLVRGVLEPVLKLFKGMMLSNNLYKESLRKFLISIEDIVELIFMNERNKSEEVFKIQAEIDTIRQVVLEEEAVDREPKTSEIHRGQTFPVRRVRKLKTFVRESNMMKAQKEKQRLEEKLKESELHKTRLIKALSNLCQSILRPRNKNREKERVPDIRAESHLYIREVPELSTTHGTSIKMDLADNFGSVNMISLHKTMFRDEKMRSYIQVPETRIERRPKEMSREELFYRRYCKKKQVSVIDYKSKVYSSIKAGPDEQPNAYILVPILWAIRDVCHTDQMQTRVEKPPYLEAFLFNENMTISKETQLFMRPDVIAMLEILDNIVFLGGKSMRSSICEWCKGYSDRQPQKNASSSRRKSETEMLFYDPKFSLHSTFNYISSCTINLQQLLVTRVFSTSLEAEYSLYFQLCYLIKSLIEENYLEFKEKFTQLTFSCLVDLKKKANVTLVPILLQGMRMPVSSHANSLELGEFKPEDRNDMVWLNYITVVICSELIFGSQEIFKAENTHLIQALISQFHRVCPDPDNPDLLVKEELSRLLGYCLENSPALVNSLLSKSNEAHLKPDMLYKQIIIFLKLLFISKLSETLSPAEITKQFEELSFESVKPMDLVNKYYIRYEDVSSHPALNTARLLYRLMKLLAKSQHNRKFEVYMLNLERQVADKLGVADAVFLSELNHLQSLEIMQSSINYNKDFPLFCFLKMVSATVEVRISKETHIMVDFPILPKCFFITDETKSRFMDNVTIGDQSAKLSEMMEAVQSFETEGRLNMKLYMKNPVLSFLTSNHTLNLMLILSWLVGAASNFIALMYFDFSEFYEQDHWSWMVVFFGNLFIVVWCSAMIVLYLTIQSSQNYKKRMRSHILQIWSLNSSTGLKVFQISKLVIKDMLLEQNLVIFGLFHIVFGSLYMSGYPYFLPCHLFSFIHLSKTAKYILKSITAHYNQLLYTFLLVFIMIYCYSLLIGLYFSNQFDKAKTSDLELCKDLATCLAYVLELGLKSGGGIADFMVVREFGSGIYFASFFVNVSFFIFIKLVGLNIVFGIIIDTFSELRKDLERRELDINKNCFICGIERKDFEKQDKSFDYHKATEHNLWNYIYFVIYLKYINPTEMSGVETYVKSKVDCKSQEWIPRNSTLFLDSNLGSEVHHNYSKLIDCKDWIDSNAKAAKEIEEALKTIIHTFGTSENIEEMNSLYKENDQEVTSGTPIMNQGSRYTTKTNQGLQSDVSSLSREMREVIQAEVSKSKSSISSLRDQKKGVLEKIDSHLQKIGSEV